MTRQLMVLRIRLGWMLAASLVILMFGPAIVAQTGQSPSTVFARSRPSVVLILGGDVNGNPTVQGSGFIVGQDRVVTNHHVVAGTLTALAVFSDGAVATVTNVIADSPAKDIAILGVATGKRPAVVLGDELSLKQGDPVYAIGAPEGLELTLTNGIVSSFRTIDEQFLIQSTAAIGHGSSGGPLFDQNGKVVGITSALLSSTPGIYFSVGAGDLKRLLLSPGTIVLPFAEWAKQNPSQSNSNEADESQTTDVGQIEKLLQSGKLDEAKRAIDSLRAQDPDGPVTHRLTGQLDEATGDIDGALRELNLSVQKNPSDAIAQFYYAICLYENRRFADALQHEIKSNELAPTSGDGPLLALLYYAVGDYKEAERFATNALKADSKSQAALEVLAGVSYHGVSSDHDWSKLAQQIASINPDDFWVHVLDGVEAFKQSQFATAKAAFIASEKSGFPDTLPYSFLEVIYLRESDFGQAKDQIELGLAAVPNDSALLAQAVFVALATRNNSEAGRRFQSLQEIYPDTLQTNSSGCLYYYGIGRPTSAVPFCARDTQQDPNNHIAHSNYGWALLDANEFQLAFQEFSKSYNLVSTAKTQLTEVQFVDLNWGIIISYYELDDKNEASKFLQSIRQSYPTRATVTGLQQLPLLWSALTMVRIEKILAELPVQNSDSHATALPDSTCHTKVLPCGPAVVPQR